MVGRRTGDGRDVEISKVDGTGRFFSAREADIGMASITNHSASCVDIARSEGWSVCHGIWTTRSLRMSSGAVTPSDSVNSARQINFSTSSSF